MRQSTKNLLQRLAQNTKVSFDDAKSLPPAIYHDPGILNLEIERLFRNEWICIGRTAEIPDQGDFLCRDIIDAPVLVVRQRDDSVKAFANVCVHRSSRLLSGAGHVSRISCPYHSWTYALDGQLIGAPFMDKTPGFDVANHKLKELVCETWQGFIYVSLHADPAPLDERLSALTELVGDFRMANYVPVFDCEETWNTNWKCLVESVFRASASLDAAQGPLSYLERNVWEFGRYLARNICG